MSYLFFSITVIIAAYLFSVLFIMKRVLLWKYKALIYGMLTFFMLIGVFLTFSHYDRYWKKNRPASQESSSGRLAE
jgi:hypothetical protein